MAKKNKNGRIRIRIKIRTAILSHERLMPMDENTDKKNIDCK